MTRFDKGTAFLALRRQLVLVTGVVLRLGRSTPVVGRPDHRPTTGRECSVSEETQLMSKCVRRIDLVDQRYLVGGDDLVLDDPLAQDVDGGVLDGPVFVFIGHIRQVKSCGAARAQENRAAGTAKGQVPFSLEAGHRGLNAVLHNKGPGSIYFQKFTVNGNGGAYKGDLFALLGAQHNSLELHPIRGTNMKFGIFFRLPASA